MISQRIDIKPFGDKYVEYYKRCFKNRINCLEGAYRAGKTVINVYSFANHVDYCVDKIHLVSGASAGTARLNVADCGGYGLTSIFRGRCKAGKYEGNECLRVKSKRGEKIIIFVGGALSDSYKRIQGLSFGSWLSVELANMYISDDEKDFIDMALSRLTQSKNQKIWWDLNPVFPAHKVYTKYLDKYAEQQEAGEFVGGYNYMVCSLFDNTALTDEQRDTALSRYPDKNSMEYERYIIGVRACAKGLIFQLFARDNARWIVNDVKEFLKGKNAQFISIGVDFGGNGSDTAFVATLLSNNFTCLTILADGKIDMSGGESTVQEFKDRFKEFLLFVISLKFAPVRYIWGDNEDTVMVNEIRQILREIKMYSQITVMGCQKHTIKKRIDTKKVMMARGRWFVCKEATNVINSTKTQVWDTRQGHEDERLDNGSVDIDTADAEEYSWSGFLDKLIRG